MRGGMEGNEGERKRGMQDGKSKEDHIRNSVRCRFYKSRDTEIKRAMKRKLTICGRPSEG